MKEAAGQPKINYCMVDEMKATLAAIEKRRKVKPAANGKGADAKKAEKSDAKKGS